MAYRKDDDDIKNRGSSSSSSATSGSRSEPKDSTSTNITVSRNSSFSTPSSNSTNWKDSTSTNVYSSQMSAAKQSQYYRNRYGSSQSQSQGQWQGQNSGLPNSSSASTPTNATQRYYQKDTNAFGLRGIGGIGSNEYYASIHDPYSDAWYTGDSTSIVDYAARIAAVHNGDRDMLDKMWTERFTEGSAYYNPYAGITSEPTRQLASLLGGVPEGGFTTEWFEKNASKVAPYLGRSDTTGNPGKPKKRASQEEWIAYYFYQAQKDAAQTDEAEKELAALKEELAFKGGDTSRNLSDDEIIAGIDWEHKYSTLRKMMDGLKSNTVLQFTRGIDFDESYLRGMIWAGRNGGGSGDAFTDAVNARLGAGNLWQYDEELARKRDVNSPDYDPYSLGGTMYDAQLYFGTKELGGDFVNSHRDYGVSSDRTLVGNYQSVAKADDFTVACNEELAKVKGEVDDFLEDYLKHPNSDPPSDEDIAELLDDIFKDNSDYRNIQKLNNSLVNAGKQPLEETTGIIGSGDTVGLYKRSNLERYIQERLSERASNVDPHDAANDTNKGLSGALDRMYNNVGNFFTGLFGPKEPYVPTDENGNPVEVKPEPSKANVQSSLPSMDELVSSGMAVRTASATVSDVGGSLAARPTPTPMPSATPAPGSTNTSAGTSREEYENAKKESEAWQQDMLRKRQNMAQGKFALRDTSSPTDKQTYKSAYPEFDDDVAATKDGIENGGMTEQQSYDSMLGSADALAGKTYFSDVETVESYEALQAIMAQEEAQLASMPDIPGETMPVNPQTGAPMTEDELAAARLDAMQTGDTERWEYLSQFGAAVQTDEDKRAIADKTAVRESYEQHKAQLAAMKPQYDEALGHLDAIDAKYAMAAEMVTDGVDTGLGVRATDVMDAIRNGFNEVPLPDWSAYDAYAMAEANGESQEQIVAAAKANIANDEEAITQIQALLDMADRYGLNIPDRYRANMLETLRQYEANKKDSEYYLLRTNPDFAEKVATGDSAEKWAKQKFHTGSSIGYALYAFKHNTADRSLYAQYPLMGQMSQAELDTAQYLLETQGPVTADEYYLHLGDSQYGRLNTRFTEDAMQRAAAFSDRNAVGGTVLSIAMAPLNSTGAFQIIFDKVTGRTSNPNSMLSAGQKASSAMRQEAKGQIVGTLSEPFGGADSPVGKVLGLVYDAGTSAGDTAVNMGWGKALGLVGNGSTWMDKLSVSAMNPAAAAGTSSYNEALRKGGSEQQATMMGVVSFLGEWLTEAIEMSDVMDAISTGASEAAEGAIKGIKAFLKKQIPELGNEIVGEAVSDIVERVGDDVIMGELSDKAQSIDAMTSALMDADPNMTEQLARSEAEYQAELDGWKSTAYAGLLGGFAAGISTTGGYAVGNMATTTEQFLRAYEVQRDLEAHGMPKANARVAARNIVATNADNTAVYGPQLNAELAENEAQMAQEAAEAAVAAEDLRQRTHAFAEDLNSDAAREEQNNLQQANAEMQYSAQNVELQYQQGELTNLLNSLKSKAEEIPGRAEAAARGLIEKIGSSDAARLIGDISMKAAQLDVSQADLREAIEVAAIADGDILSTITQGEVTKESLESFIAQTEELMKNPETAEEIQRRVQQPEVYGPQQQTVETVAPETQSAPRSTRRVVTSEQSQAGRAEFSRRMFALEQGSMGGTSQKVVAITSVLDQDTASSDELTQAQARAAAQGLVETYGDKAIPVIQRLMMRARTEGVDNGAVMEAVQVAALSDGAANQVFAGLSPRAISAENFNAFMQAANLDMADQEIRGQMRKRTYDVMIAAEKARRISEGAAKDLQAAAERKRSASRRRQHAQEQHEAKVQEVEAINESLAQADAEFDAEITGDTENAIRDVASDLPGAIIAEQQLAQQQRNAEAEEAAAVRAEKEATQAVDAELTRQAQQAVEERMRAVQETRERRADIVEAQRRAIMGGTGTMFVDPKTKLEFHYAIVPVNALITSNTDNGGVNPDYPARLQPRDRTRYSSQVDLENMANGGLTPELLGADNRVQHGAPVVGPDFIVESGNQRTMGIRKAMQNGKANGYTEWLRDNAESFGFAPDVVTDNSVLVRVRDTDVDRVAFTREANTVDMAKLSPSETAAVDADMLTPERMAMFVPNDNGSVDNADNSEFVKMYRQEIIPEYERGSYQDNKGKNTEDLYRRIKRGLFNRAYHDSILTAAVTENTGDEVKNIMNAMTNVAPKVALVADGVASGNLYDLDVTQNIVDAAKLIREIRRDGISLDERLNQGNMFEESIDPTTIAIAQMFDANKRSGTKMTRALNNLLDDITNLGAPDQVRLDGMELTEAPDKATFVQNSLNRTAGVVELESQGAVEGQTSMLEGVTSDVTSTDETAPTTEQAAPTTAPTTDEIEASNVGAPNPAPQSQDNRQIKSGYEIIRDIENATGIKIDERIKKYLRGKRKNTKGYTARGRDIVHIQDANDVETAAHEIGHKVSDTFNLPSVAPTQKMVDYLMNHPDPKVRAWIKSYDPNQRANESIADFCKYWMIDRNLAIQFAGEDFVNDWESKLASRGWLKPMQRASEDLRLNRAATNADRAVASIVMQTKDHRDKYERGVLGFLTSFADYTLPLLDMEVARKEQQGTKIKGGIVAYEASSDPRTLMLARNGGSIINFANLCMEETMVDPTGNPVLRDDGTEWGSFRDIFKDIDINRGAVFSAIWELQNAKDRRNYGKDVFAKDIDIDAAYDQLARENPDLVEAYKKANAWMAKFIETWVVEPGMLGVNGKALWERMRKMYPNWAPAFRPTEQQSRLTSATNYRSPTSGMMRADGSTSPVIDPVLGCAEYVKRYITNYRTAEALRGLINSANNIKGFEAVMEPAQFDLKSQSETTQNDVVTRRVLEALQELQEAGSITEEGINKVEEVLNNLPDISFFAKRQDGTDVINVPMPDGSINSQTVYQPEILRAMTVAPASQRNRWIQAVGNIAQSLTGFLTANATARSIVFSEQNVFSDSETAMVTGHAAGNPLTFTFEWLKTAGYHLEQNIREARGQEVDQRMQLFKLFGAYGSRFSLKNEDDQVALRRKLFKSKSTLGEKVTLPLRAIEAITGFGEDTTRLMQFLSSYDKLIKAGVDEYDARLISGKIAHEASTDFKKSGMASDQISGIRKIIPFFNGQLQGVYKTVRMFSKENAGHRAQMVQRMVFSSLMTSLVASALRELLCDDKDKEEYDMLTAQERNKYHHIKIGDRWWRFKKSQDGIIQMADNVGEVLGNLLTGYEGDELGDLCSLSQSVASNMILSFDTVFDPVIDAWNGVTWSGQSTVDHELAGLSVTQQYNASTPWLCRALSNIPVLGKQIAPQGWEYILKQYTGSAGMLGSEMMSLFTEDVGSAENALYVFRNHFASKLSVDPVYSNALASTYKESKNNMTEAINDAKAGHAVAHFRPGLSQSQVDKGIKEARELTSSKGKLTKIGKEINDLWKKHESILKNTDMTKEDRAAMARDVRVQINSKYLQANEIMGDYWMKYGYRSKTAENIGNFLSTMFIEKKVPKYKK